MTSTLKAAVIRFPHVEGLIDRSVELSDGAVIRTDEVPQDLGFDNSAGFDAWEIPIVRYIAGRESGYEVSGFPVFTSRRFIQWMIEVPEDSDIEGPKDLEGKRIILRYAGNTDAVWTKGLLQDTYGLDLSGVSWFTMKPERVLGHGAQANVTCIDGSDPDDLLLRGIVDAAFCNGHGEEPPPGIRRLWTNPEIEAAKWYASWRVFPILHVMVVRNSTLAVHPRLASDLYRVFDQAKQQALEKWDYGASLPEEKRARALWSGFPGSAWGGADRSYLPKDPLPYGLDLEANRENLERIIRYSYEQGAAHELHSLDELFIEV